MKKKDWVGIDLDGTLAYYDGWKGVDHIGRPIIPIVRYAKQLIDSGQKVKIFTARIAEGPAAINPIRAWLKEAGLPGNLELTNIKDMHMVSLIDDRCRQVETNTGRFVAHERPVPTSDEEEN